MASIVFYLDCNRCPYHSETSLSSHAIQARNVHEEFHDGHVVGIETRPEEESELERGRR